MTITAKFDPVIDTLGQVLDQGNLPPPFDRCGARLLTLLTRPVQVVVTGFAGSGKTKLIEMMAARPDIGHLKSVPVFELSFGDTEQALIERADGSVSTVAGLLKDGDIPDDAVRARQELPDPRLVQQDFIEIGLYGTDIERRRALEVVTSRADLIVWCTQDFAEDEQQLWSTVPEHIKDHSVLVLTMADQQLMRGVLTDNIARLGSIVADEFLGLFPVATIQGITAQTSAEVPNDALWASSGGKSLMQLVSRQVRHGRSADIDQARIFLNRLSLKVPQEALGSDTPNAAAQITASNKRPAADQNSSGDQTTAALVSETVDVLQQHAARLLDALDQAEKPDTDMILEGCSDAINSVNALFASAVRGDPVADTLRADVQEGEEMLMLFQLERGEDAALDAVTLVLQLRKELSDKVGF